MKRSRFYRRVPVRVAGQHGDRLWLAPEWRHRIIGRMIPRVGLSVADEVPFFPGCDARTCLPADWRAFARSVAYERLANLYLALGSFSGAYRALCRAAVEALCGEAYDQGSESLPSRFLRIRFYRLFDRVLACRAADPRLRSYPIDPELLLDARRLGGEFL